MMTRKTRNDIKKGAENNFKNLNGDLMHKEMSDYAESIYAVLSLISTKYSSDAIVELIPEVVTILNRLDASLKVTEDITQSLNDIHKENLTLKRAVSEEKHQRQNIFEESLSFEEDWMNERATLLQNIKSLEIDSTNLAQELKNKEKIVEILSADCTTLQHKVKEYQTNYLFNQTNKEESFIKPKINTKQVNNINTFIPEITTFNHFDILSASIDEPPTLIQVNVDVHNPHSHSPTRTATRVTKRNKQSEKKGRIAVLSDSHGRNLQPYIQTFSKTFTVSVLSKPGAKLKHIIKEGELWVKYFTYDDYLVIMGGANDIGKHEPRQLTIAQAIKNLLSWKIKTNVVLVEIPYRYDLPSLNNDVFYANLAINNLIKEFKGNIRITSLGLNELVHRHNYTRHGLHFRKSGKRTVGKTIADHVESLNNKKGNIQSMKDEFVTVTEKSNPLERRKVCHNTISSLDAIDVIEEDSRKSHQLPPALAARQPPGASFTYIDEFLDDSQFHWGMDDFPPLPVSQEPLDVTSNKSTELFDETFLEVVVNSTVIR